jgi:phosphoserine phosphatase
MVGSNVMNKVNVFDMDGTLLTSDTANFLFRQINLAKRLHLAIIYLIGGSEKFHLKLYGMFEKNAEFKAKVEIHDFFLRNLNTSVMKLASESSREHIKVVCSGSHEYLVKKFCEIYGFDIAIGSTASSLNKGMRKLKNIELIFPREKFVYSFAISDNEEDLIWMKEFENYFLIT